MSDAIFKIRRDFLVLHIRNPYEAIQMQTNDVSRMANLINVATVGLLMKAETHWSLSEADQSLTKLAYSSREHLQTG